jgi:hypothetical protein
MRRCRACKHNLNDDSFIKYNIPLTYYKLCEDCRAKARIANNKRRDAKSLQAKEYYHKYKEEISQKNKEYRIKNKDKLREYEQSLKRKEVRSQWTKNKRKEDPCRFIFYSAKRRSKIDGTIFTINKQDVIDVYPKDGKCPMLGIDMMPNIGKMQDNSPSLDRIIPGKGYSKGNIIVISYKANRIKNDASLQDLKNVVLFLESLGVQ